MSYSSIPEFADRTGPPSKITEFDVCNEWKVECVRDVMPSWSAPLVTISSTDLPRDGHIGHTRPGQKSLTQMGFVDVFSTSCTNFGNLSPMERLPWRLSIKMFKIWQGTWIPMFALQSG